MSSMPIRRRRNPRWEEDGPVARREHRRRRALALMAFGASLSAAVLAGAVWAVHLGMVQRLPG